MVVIILAAGYATRLYPLTLDTPKALLPIGSITMLDHIIEKIHEIEDVTQIVVISNARFYGQFVEWLDSRGRATVPGYSAIGCGTQTGGFVDQAGGFGAQLAGSGTQLAGSGAQLAGSGGKSEPEILLLNDGTTSEDTRLGAIGDISYALRELSIDNDVMIIAGDNFFTFKLIDFYNFYKKIGADCIVVKKLADHSALKSVGVAVVAPDLKVVEFEEKPANPKSDLAVYASYIYKRDTLPLFQAYLDEGNHKDAPGYFPAWLCKRKPVYAYYFDGDCYDIGTPEAYADICGRYADICGQIS